MRLMRSSGIVYSYELKSWAMQCGPDKLVPIVYLEVDGNEVKPPENKKQGDR